MTAVSLLAACNRPPAAAPNTTTPSPSQTGSAPPASTSKARPIVPIVPRPAVVRVKGDESQGTWVAIPATPVVSAPPAFQREADAVRALLSKVAASPNAHSTYQPQASARTTPAFVVELVHTAGAPEGYLLDIDTERIRIESADAAGAFYAVQSLRQLVRPATQGHLEVPAMTIEDRPRFAYRGLMLDVGRHFRSVAFIEQLLDWMAFYKLNRFHWHLTEDQGWRLQLKRYPRLTEVGAFRNGTLIGHANERPQRFDDERHGGFYTEDDVRKVVRYAAERHIEVIPEIELPGHATAALAAHSELACTAGPFEVEKSWGIFDDVFCPTETTFEFLENVLDEVVRLFPSQYVHIGGDEVPKKRWEESPEAQAVMKREGLQSEEELQSYFIRRIARFLQSRGKKLIGWDEILEGGLANGATVMSWRGMQGGVETARLGHDVIMTPGSHVYFDHYQSRDQKREPLAIGGYTPLETVYGFEPVPSELEGDAAAHVLGTQANVWTEYMRSDDQVEYMIFPRLLALSEVAWSPVTRRDWSDFVSRVIAQLPALEAAGVDYADHVLDIHQYAQVSPDGTLRVTLESPAQEPIAYAIDEPLRAGGARYHEPLLLRQSGTVAAAGVNSRGALRRPSGQSYLVSRATGRPVVYETPPSADYPGGGQAGLVDGLPGSENFRDGRWQGFDGADLAFTLDFAEPTEIRTVEVGFLHDPGSWIFFPRRLECSVASDGERFHVLGAAASPAAPIAGAARRVHFRIEHEGTRATHLRCRAENFGELPQEHPGQGKPAWLFADEIIVH